MNKFKTLLLVALVIRFLLSITTYHSDLGAFALAGKYIVGEGKWLSFYDTIASVDSAGQMVIHRTDMVFNYQPLAYLIPSVIYLPFINLVSHTGDLLINRQWIESTPLPFNFTLFVYKLPMLLGDLGIFWLLTKFFSSSKSKQTALLLWAFNPLAIYVSSMMGQVDIIIAFFLLLSVYFYRNHRYLYAVVAVSLSALIKPIGLILLPLLILDLLVIHKNWRKAIWIGLAGVGTYILGILPYIGSASYRYYALFAQQIGKSTYAAISIASGTVIPYFFISLTVIFFLFYFRKVSFLTAFIAIILSSLAFTHFHPQWLLWIMPLLIIRSIESADYLLLLSSIACWFGVLFSFDATLQLQMFLHSRLVLPTTLTLSELFTQVIQICRAGLIGTLVTLMYQKDINENPSTAKRPLRSAELVKISTPGTISATIKH